MRRPAALLSAFLALLASAGAAAASSHGRSPGPSNAPPPRPGTVRVRMETSMGAILIDLDLRHAPITAANFLTYVDEHRFDGTGFYRVAPSRRNPGTGFVQGGINHVATRAKFAIPHEPTSLTGLHHTDGAISMARNAPGTAAGDFCIMIGDERFLDARPGSPGYAAFGHVAAGMDVVRAMLPLPTYPGGYTRETIGQTLRQQVRIIRVTRAR